MVYQIPQIMRDVRIAIDENMVSEQLINDGDIETLSLDEIIRSKITEAVRRVHSNAALRHLEGGHDFAGQPIYWEEKHSGHVLLPDDFMRLVSFKMSDWERACHYALDEDSPRYVLQSSRYLGIRGTAQKPVCVLVHRPEGKALEFYSCKGDDAEIVQASYIPYPVIEHDGIDISERCYLAVVYTVAALVQTTYGEVEKAMQMDNLAKSLME